MPSALHLLTTPFLLLFSLPLAVFAAFTTSLAFSTLLIRVSIVYVELGIALVQSAVQAPVTTNSPPPARPTAPWRHKRRRSSNFSTASSQDPHATPAGRKPPTKSDSLASLLGAGGPTRDYEGVGGWRFAADGDEDALWMGMNSRLELPAAPSNYVTGRRHVRSLTSGSQRFQSPELLRGSPVVSRARTPAAGSGSPEGYFNIKDARSTGMVTLETSLRNQSSERRKSLSGSSTESSGSANTSRLVAKQSC
ncbi:hypothetical protein BJ546DRAFT_215676 [Cryomyces antarcticus]